MPHKKRIIDKTFGRQLKKFRANRGLTLDDVAEKMGVHRTTISKYELSQRDPALSFVFEISKAYGVPVSYFNSEENEEEDLK